MGPLALGGRYTERSCWCHGKRTRSDRLLSSYLPWIRLLGGLLLVLAGVWVVVAGPLFHHLWLDLIGLAMLILGDYLFHLGLTELRHVTDR